VGRQTPGAGAFPYVIGALRPSCAQVDEVLGDPLAEGDAVGLGAPVRDRGRRGVQGRVESRLRVRGNRSRGSCGRRRPRCPPRRAAEAAAKVGATAITLITLYLGRPRKSR